MKQQANTDKSDEILVSMNGPLSSVIKEVERRYLERALTLASGNKIKAAAIAGVSHDTFRKKLARYTIQAVYSLA